MRNYRPYVMKYAEASFRRYGWMENGEKDKSFRLSSSANRDLIAAAPALLAACETMDNIFWLGQT